uniref:Uncharacterized protein n=1 Tax=Myoviridae sp. ctCo31 TaxID=2825053 RepID=A0A8S5UM60_9CAUD|nr:MAG TPA: hypothetical protein [Myoviridae sp. ctCo31]
MRHSVDIRNLLLFMIICIQNNIQLGKKRIKSSTKQ